MMQSLLTVLHRHSADDWEEMRPREDLSPADVDPERDWDNDGAVYECPCGNTFVIGPTTVHEDYKVIPRA